MGIEDNLHEGEKVFKKFHPSPLNYWFWYLLGFFTIWFFFLGVLIIIWKEMERRKTTYLVTDKRIIKEVGIMGKRTTSTIYRKITDVHMTQSMIQRMLGIGNIILNTAGGEGPEIILSGIDNAPAVKKEIEKAWTDYK